MRICFHCDLPIPDNIHYGFIINGEFREFCCAGCEAVAGAIVHGGLSDYYRYRTNPAVSASITVPSITDDALMLYDRADVLAQYASFPDKDTATIILLINGITCAACTWLIEQQIQRLSGAPQLNVNLSTHRATVTWHPSLVKLSTILKEINCIGYQAEPYHVNRSDIIWQTEQRNALRRLGVAGIGMMQVMMYAASLYIGNHSTMDVAHENFLRWISLIITTPVLLYAGHPFLMGAIRDIRSQQLTMDIPITLGIWCAYLASVWSTIMQRHDVYFDSVSMFIFFLLISRYFEMRARLHYAQSGNQLMKLLPQHAWCIKDYQPALCLVNDLQPNDLVFVKAGETIPIDGVVVEGESAVNESTLTGEYIPIHKKNGSSVSAGTINTENSLTIKTVRIGGQSQLSSIMRLLERAQSEKPYLAQMADKIARWFVGIELLLALIIGAIWYAIDPSRALWISISILVVTCPCALSLAIPTAITAATTALRQHGILITRGHVLESLTHITQVVFDKTGTITEGAFEIEKIIPCSTLNEAQCLTIAASLETHSEHPIAKAFIGKPTLPVERVNIRPSAGISGYVDKQYYAIGMPSFALPAHPPTHPDTYHQWLLLADDTHALAWFLLQDRIRPSAFSVITWLKKMGLSVTLLSGDSSNNVTQVSAALAIDKYLGNMKPTDKLNYIREQQEKNERILMVGDGVNDVLGLARAHISVAMGSSTDLTRTQSDVVLLHNDLRALITLLQKAKKTRFIIHENLLWTILYNALVLPLAAGGLMTPYWATIGMSLSSMFVVANALRLSRAQSTTSSALE